MAWRNDHRLLPFLAVFTLHVDVLAHSPLGAAAATAPLTAPSPAVRGLHLRRRLGGATVLAAQQRQGAMGDQIPQVAAMLGQADKTIALLITSAATAETSQRKECGATIKTLSSSRERWEQNAREAQEDLVVIRSEAAAAGNDISSTKEKIAATSQEIDSLLVRLREVRESQKKQGSTSVVSMRQVEDVISHAERERAATEARSAASPLRAEVSDLQRLGRGLAFAGGRKLPPPAFMQTAASTGRNFRGRGRHHRRKHHARGKEDHDAWNTATEESGSSQFTDSAVRTLREDERMLTEAGSAVKRELDEEEARILELVRLERAELAKLEKTLRAQQPALAEQLKQVAELSRTLDAAKRGHAHDSIALNVTAGYCAMVTTVAEAESKQRSRISDSLRTANALLKGLDTVGFLARDLRDLGDAAPASLVQVASRRTHAEAPSTIDATDSEFSTAADAIAANPPSDGPALVELSGGGAAMEAASTGGPFDSVVQMIQALLVRLRDQQNSDVDRNQFCSESVAANRRTHINVQNAIDEEMEEIRRAEASVAKLDAEIAFFERENERLLDVEKSARTKLTEVSKMKLSETRGLDTVMQSAQNGANIINGLCNPVKGETVAPVFVEGNLSDASGQGREAHCTEVVHMLHDVVEQCRLFQQIQTTSKDKIIEKVTAMKTNAYNARRQCASDRLASQAARGRRADELAKAKGELVDRQRDLALIEKAKKRVGDELQPRPGDDEERARRQADEIEALKNALSVLEGESIPVEG
eukprot:CAMPEP_0117585176 /NCGR_PEP_ID=MMETSP0784-20121206/68002_1 /TAXON_ID=39447 /ORGANISM="" /LENGTH=763 /DNA_ID=CAMNT_0005386099 /DNA_START=41 /DNA_END=2333 /DNA_ORIENTATION=-